MVTINLLEFFIAVFFVGTVAVSRGIKCYVCNSSKDASCFDKYNGNSNHLVTCASGEGCSKKKTKSLFAGLSYVAGMSF